MSRAGIVRFGELTSPEADRAREAGALLILPIGATEQHGDGLPLATDTIRAEHVAERVAARLGGDALVLPTLPYGVSPHHVALPGTITVPPGIIIDLLTSIVTGLADAGWRRVLVITGHGGNAAVLSVVQQSLLSTHPALHYAWSPITGLATQTHRAMQRTQVTGHSGESETAQVLAIDADLVDRPNLRKGATTLDELGPRARLSRGAGPSIAVRFDDYAPNGVLGDPTTVTAADGEAVLEEAVTTLTAFARSLIDL